MAGATGRVRGAAQWLAAALVLGFSGVTMAQSGKPAVCDDPPTSFETGPRKPLSRVHGEVIALLGQPMAGRPTEKEAKAASLLRPMREFMDAMIRRRGDGSVEVALLRSDLADLISDAPAADSREIEGLRRAALPVLAAAPELEATEVAIVVDRKLHTRSGTEVYPGAVAVLQRHRRAAGDVARAIPLWKAVIDAAPSTALRERVTRDQVTAALGSGQSRWLLEARADLLDSLVHSASGKSFTDLDNAGRIRESLRGLRTGGEILAVAREMLPEMRRRQEWDIEEDSCRWLNASKIDPATKTLIALGGSAEGREALGISMRASALHGFQTDNVGAVVNLSPALAARTVDRTLYLRGMRVAAGSLASTCEMAPSVPEVCGLMAAADAYQSMGSPGAAVPLLHDAVEIAERSGSSPTSRAELLLKLAEITWEHGTASEVPGLLTQVEALLGLGDRPPRNEMEVKALKLRALVADAQLDDATALGVYARIVSAAIVANRTLDRDKAARASGHWYLDPLKQSTYRAAVDLTRRHLRRRFCTGCAPEGEVARPALDWLAAVFDPANGKGFVPRPADFLLLPSLPAAAWPAAMQRQAEEQFRKSLPEQFGTQDVGFLPRLQEIRRRMPAGSDLAAALKALALSSIITGNSSEVSEAAAFMTFLAERDLDRKRQLWQQYLKPIAEDNYEQFGSDSDLYDDLDILARGAMASGYGLAGRVVFETLLDRLAEGASRGTTPGREGLAQLREQTGLAVPALVRVAGFAIDRREWAVAHNLLDLASTLVRQRLANEWAVGNERAAASLRESRGALRLLAQLRARLVQDPAARTATADGAARLFADFQLAMLSETALVTQAVDRRRIMNDAALTAAVGQRNALARDLALAEALRLPSEQWGLAEGTEAVKRIEADRARAAEAVGRLLPVAEDLVSPAPVALADAQRSLAPDEGLLVLHAGSDAVYGLLATPGRQPVVWTSRITLKDLEARIGSIRAGVDLAGGSLPRFPYTESAELYDLLLKPAAGTLADVRHLLLVADGPLQLLPLSILLTERPSVLPAFPDEIRSASLPWLARRHAITVLTSVRAATTRGTGQLASRATTMFAGIGNPVLNGPPGLSRGVEFAKASVGSGLADVEILRRMAALPDTEIELRKMGARFKARSQDILLGAEATESAVKRMPLSAYRIVTFATHGLVAGTASGGREPGLVMTPPAKPTLDDDGYLSASEIAALKLDADLVILSACNTASSDGRPRAEGLSGLARAFLSAGARSVLATHWAIPSAPSVEITTRMVDEYEGKALKEWGRSLQLSILRVIDEIGPPEYAHPANWGAFVAVGLPQRSR